MTDDAAPDSPAPDSPPPAETVHKRRPRYSGKNPRKFSEKYKEHAATADPATVAKVLAAGKTPAGTHRPVMVAEVLAALDPRPGDVVADCTLGWGGHARELLGRILPGGRLLGLDVDPLEQPKTEARLRDAGFGPEVFSVHHSNFAGLPQVLAGAGLAGADVVFADLGVSSMQIDDPARGFSVKQSGPLDMRMNPRRGQPASAWLARVSPPVLARALYDHADEPRAEFLAPLLAGKTFATTDALAAAIRAVLPPKAADDADLTVRRVFQALRIAVNDEFSALETLLRVLPTALNPGGRVAILTFHSGEDRRVKKAFAAGLAAGVYAAISEDVVRPSPAECGANPRAKPTKLRWARRAE